METFADGSDDPGTEKQTEEVVENDADSGFSLIASLPFELLAAILAQIAIESPRAFVRTLLIGRQFWIPHDSALLWEPICRKTYPELDTGELHADDYGGFYNLYRRRPAIRYNGVYICVSRYYRDGETNLGTISFSTPRHEVRYYRYLWFQEDGKVSSLLSNYPPKKVLGLEGPVNGATFRDKMAGTWELDPVKKVVKIVVDGGSRRKSNFHFMFEIASSGGKIHNKLKWRKYWYEEHGSNNTADFNVSNEGSYYFCKIENLGF